MQITVKRGSDATALLSDTDFRKQWDTLKARCPWATPWQSYAYANCWYQAYEQQYTPLLLFTLSEQKHLCGILPLAICKATSCVEIAGGHQAEYKAWLAEPSYGEIFIKEALQTLFQKMHFKHLRLKYVLEAAPQTWTRSKEWKKRCVVRALERPILQFTDTTFNLQSLANRGFRKKLNRLKRKGEIHYSHIVDYDTFQEIMPQLQAIYDFRMLATYGIAPFSTDGPKLPFHLALFAKENLLHVSALFLDKQVVAYKIALLQDDEMFYGIISSFSPFFSEYKPTKLYSYFLFQELIENGFTHYDFTPGRDAYKNASANKWETVFEINIFNTPLKRHLFSIAAVLRECIIQIVFKLRIKQGPLRLLAKSFGNNLLAGLFYDVKHKIFQESAILYRVNRAKAKQLPGCRVLTRDTLAHFLMPHPQIPEGIFNSFPGKSQTHFHAGHHSYTATEGTDFFFCAWLLAPLKQRDLTPNFPDSVDPKKSAVIKELTLVGEQIPARFLEEALSQMIHEAADFPENEEIFMIVPNRDRQLNEVIATLNDKYTQLFDAISG